MKEEKFEINNAQDAMKRLMSLTNQREAMEIVSAFREQWKEWTPNVAVAYHKDGKPESYSSTLEGFPSYGFGSELEANLANALFLIYKSTGKEFNRERFTFVFQLVLELLDVESNWRMSK